MAPTVQPGATTLYLSAVLASIGVASAIYAGLASGRSRWPAMVLCVFALSACIVAGGASAIMAARTMSRPILAGALAVSIPLILILIGYCNGRRRPGSDLGDRVTRRFQRAVAPCVIATALATGCSSVETVTVTDPAAATQSTTPEASDAVAAAPSPEVGVGRTAAQTDVALWCEAFFEFDDEPTTQRAELVFEAPPESIATDLATLRPLFAAVSSYDESDETAEQALATLRAEPSISAASERVNAYVDSNC